MSQLPEEVLTDILSRLPVTTLLQFRCVSVSWRDLIDSSDFFHLHLHRSIETRTNRSLILRQDNRLSSLEFDSLYGSAVIDAVQITHHPLWCQDYGTHVWGSCDGLLCMSNTLDTLVLWNPSTRRSRRLPYASIEFQNLSRYYESRVYGFGYDRVSRDYKVVRIVVLKGIDDGCFDFEVKVYSVRSNSWHRAKKFPRYPNLQRAGGVLAGGVLHWVVTTEPEAFNPGLIIGFDLGREEFKLVPQPVYSDGNFFMDLQSLGGCLSLICNYYLDRVDIWVMKEYGVNESWSKLISIVQPGVIGPFQYVMPIAYSQSGEEILLEQDTRRFLWYNLEREAIKNVRMRSLRGFSQVEMWVGSLVPLTDGSEIDPKKQQEQEEKNILGSPVDQGREMEYRSGVNIRALTDPWIFRLMGFHIPFMLYP
ncbi:hypothetical protein RHMOL_Rhmol11G0064200 [Rhododendron molle]|uniref:Uncharacterized protein n=1 Tax=Rhododendron molle TaxID=49168 RepID=A0ACC0LQA4_RHOML|nr:hypothetical protein RHMOL_Rhmol11G0064200 [Rhododendron molle]